ncbi:CTLH/CRA C-terminal to lish motif domain-containing protein [Pterulicium gracile]|uniref:CTLH/CRA C-terminal to lish motif domain-containing protein n=1 Tax=Pterulicium gracile TaxID=1884261 RepID=A0A5C3QW14_9AGAR|nr:CTLH/CRA C-terminal to lish motif domain-containing protein [Pterula gracilis]
MSLKLQMNIDGIMLLEQPFARVPCENYRKVFRTSQKYVEKELGGINTTCNDASTKSLSPEESLKAIDSMLSRAENLKRKLNELNGTAGQAAQDTLRARYGHLAAAESFAQSESGQTQFSQWADTRSDRWLVDWMLRAGRETSAKAIASQKGIQKLVDLELFADIRRIEDALRGNSCMEALAWCNENKTQLRKMKSTLEFDLRLQEYVELARARKTHEAMAYSKKYLASWHDTHPQQIKQASALLAFPPTTACGPYKRLYDPGKRVALIESFRVTAYTLHCIPTEPLLHLALYSGLASLKLPACKEHSTKNVDCPVCDTSGGLGALADEVPFSHHVNSTIVCKISGKIMNEDNAPMAFPNGYVYSRLALEDMAMKNNGLVTCPRTKTTCEFKELRKLYIS